AEDGIRDKLVTGVQTCALPIFAGRHHVVADAQDFPEPALEDDVAGVVHDAKIARPEPAVIGECLRRLLGLLPVAARDAWPAKLRSEERRVGKEWNVWG